MHSVLVLVQDEVEALRDGVELAGHVVQFGVQLVDIITE